MCAEEDKIVDIRRFGMLALFAVPAVAFAQGAPTLAPFPTVEQLIAAIHAQTVVIENRDYSRAPKLSLEEREDQMDMLGREYSYWWGAWEIAKFTRDMDEESLKARPSLLTEGARTLTESDLSTWKRKCDLLLAAREELREQRRLINAAP